MGDHAIISPSKLDALALCPGRLAAEKGLPEEPPGQAAIDGTRRHALSEWRLKNPQEPWPTELVYDDLSHPVMSEDVRMVEQVLPYALDHASLTDPVGRQWIEQKVEVGKYLGFPDGLCWGTLDLGAVTANTLEVIDWKFGHRIISPDSWQLKAYAIGLGAELDWNNTHRQVREVRLTIGQPASSEVIRSASFPVTDLVDKWAPELKKIIAATQDPNAPRIPGDKQCKWCRAAATCRARLDSVAGGMFTALGGHPKEPEVAPGPLPPVASVDIIQDIAELKLTQPVSDVTPNEMGAILDQAPLIRGFLNDIEARAKEMLGKGARVPGWKLVPGRNSKKWTVEDSEVEKVLKSCGLRITDIYERKVPTPAAAEAKVKIKGRKQMEKLEPIIKLQPGAPVLAPTSSPKPSVAEGMFEKVETKEAQEAPVKEEVN